MDSLEISMTSTPVSFSFCLSVGRTRESRLSDTNFSKSLLYDTIVGIVLSSWMDSALLMEGPRGDLESIPTAPSFRFLLARGSSDGRPSMVLAVEEGHVSWVLVHPLESFETETGS